MQRGQGMVAVVIIALLIIVGGIYFLNKARKDAAPVDMPENTEQSTTDTSASETVRITLDEQNKSGQAGEAVLTAVGTSTVKVVLSMSGKTSTTSQPAHIHIGACPNPGAVQYPLTNVENDGSETIIAVAFDELLSALPLAINVHKSAAAVKIYTSCGDIKTERPAAAVPEGKETTVTYGVSGFSPKTITIKKGDTVLFENKTEKAASIASDVHPTHTIYPEFDQYKTDQRGKSEFRFTFEKAGTWGYHDHLNANMTGTVIVTE